MWRSLDDGELIQAYRRGPFPGGSAPPALVRVLEGLRGRQFASKVFAVTSLGHLRLTTAPDFTRQEAHDFVAVEPNYVGYFEAGCRKSAAGRWCREEELPDVVECYLLRLLLQSP